MKNNPVLYDKKWWKFLRRARLFKHLPFIEFVMASGALALGGIHEDSDFDVLVAAKKGRLYTARFFCLLVFGLLGWRREIDRPRDGFCFNHFVTSASFCLPPPRYEYDHRLYKNLVPIIGPAEKIKEFYQANYWLDGVPEPALNLQYRDVVCHDIGGLWLEKMLSGKLGNILEKVLKSIQSAQIKRNINRYRNERSRLFFDENEVRLWFNPKN